MIQGHMEHALFQKGYVKMNPKYSENSVSLKKLVQEIPEHSPKKTVADMVRENCSNNDDAEEILQNISDKTVIGALDPHQKVSTGMFLHFSPNGYPIAISRLKKIFQTFLCLKKRNIRLIFLILILLDQKYIF